MRYLKKLFEGYFIYDLKQNDLVTVNLCSNNPYIETEYKKLNKNNILICYESNKFSDLNFTFNFECCKLSIMKKKKITKKLIKYLQQVGFNQLLSLTIQKYGLDTIAFNTVLNLNYDLFYKLLEFSQDKRTLINEVLLETSKIYTSRYSKKHQIEAIIFLLDKVQANVSYNNYQLFKNIGKYANLEYFKILEDRHLVDITKIDSSIVNRVYDRNEEFIRYLIEQNYDNNFNKDDLIISAIINRRLDMLKFMIKKGYNIYAQNKIALTVAFENNDFEMISYLLTFSEFEINVDTSIIFSRAIELEQKDIIKLLLTLDSELKECSELFEYAIRCNKEDICLFLLDYFNLEENIIPYLIYRATKEKLFKLIKELIPLVINLKNDYLKRSLICVLRENEWEIIEYFLNSGIDIKLTDIYDTYKNSDGVQEVLYYKNKYPSEYSKLWQYQVNGVKND